MPPVLTIGGQFDLLAADNVDVYQQHGSDQQVCLVEQEIFLPA